MYFWEFLFITSCLLIFYNYIGYALFLMPVLLVRKKNKRLLEKSFYPSVSFIVAGYNEEDCIEEKIQNSLAQDYPKELIEFIFITDGSTDQTNSIIQRYPDIKLLFEPERKGKSAALNRATKQAGNDILIFSDANAILNNEATKKIARHYSNPLVGGVAGEKKVIHLKGPGQSKSNSEGIYWKYESILKRVDSNFYSVVGAAGELFSLRKELYEPIPDSVILDDFVSSMKVAQKGYRIIYEPDAFASELPSFSIKDEKKRKIRIAAGGYQAMFLLSSLFQFWKTPKLSFLYISHRVMRWTLSPLCLFLAFISNLLLFSKGYHPFYTAAFYLQILFYTFAFIGSIAPPGSGIGKLPTICYYFVFMNWSVVLGFFRFLRGGQSATWEKAKRTQSHSGK